jgi:hypothetical protein
MRFEIRFDPWYRRLSAALLIRPSQSYVELADDGEVEVRMAWAFRARFPRPAIVSAQRSATAPMSRGVHGFAGRWLVNGSGGGIVELTLAPEQRGRVMGVPVRLRELLVSLDDPDGLIAAFACRTDRGR